MCYLLLLGVNPDTISFGLLRYTWKLYSERLMTLTGVYGFWKYVSNLERRETRRYLEMFYALKYRSLVSYLMSARENMCNIQCSFLSSLKQADLLMHLFLEPRQVLFHCPTTSVGKKNPKPENHRLRLDCSPQFALLVVYLSYVY